MKKNLSQFTATDKTAISIIVIGLLGMFILPYLVTQTSLLNWFNVDFGDSNEIGDMIGGIVGPFMGLMSACLVYLTLREQIKSNELTRKQFEKQEIIRIESEFLFSFLEKIKQSKADLNSVDYEKYVSTDEKNIKRKNQGEFYSATFNLIIDYNLFLVGDLPKEVSLSKLEQLLLIQIAKIIKILSDLKFALSHIHERPRLLLISRELDHILTYDVGISAELVHIIAFRELPTDKTIARKPHNHLLFRLFELYKIDKDLKEKLYNQDFKDSYHFVSSLEDLFLNDQYFKEKITLNAPSKRQSN